jgi:signal transduction histidine kinase
VIEGVDGTIRQVRSSIFELGSDGSDQGVRPSVQSLLRELDPVVGFEVRAVFDGPIDSAISDQVAEHLLATLREAVTNVGRHARATHAEVHLSVDHDHCLLRVTDNGWGMHGTDRATGGLGMANMLHRAEKLKGEFVVESPVTGGTILTWRVPLDQGH